jgi:6-phosphogluconolactonase
MTRYVYISLGGDNQLLQMAMDTTTGVLTRIGEVPVDGGPGSLGIGPSQGVLYAALRGTESIAAFEIKPGGVLEPMATISAGFNPVFVGTDRTGRYLLASSYNAGKIAVFGINEDGSLAPEALDRHDTAEHAHSIWVAPSNRFVYVPHTAPPNAVYQFKLEAGTGKLTPVTPEKLVMDTIEGPRHMAFHTELDIAYSVNENGSSVTAFSLNTATGVLSPLQTISTLPADFDGDNTCADIVVHPSGQYLYATNRGHDSVASYTIDRSSGKLTSTGNTATEKTPRAFALTPDGAFLIAAGQSSGRLATYRVNEGSGQLEPLDTIEVGKNPCWVLPVDLP